MVSSCSAFGCTNRYNKDDGIGFFRFPLKNKQKLEKWVKAVRRDNWVPNIASKICGAHFQSGKPSLDNLHPDYVPNVFTYGAGTSKTSVASFKRKQAVLRKRSTAIVPSQPLASSPAPSPHLATSPVPSLPSISSPTEAETCAANALLDLATPYIEQDQSHDLIQKLYNEMNNLRMEKRQLQEKVEALTKTGYSDILNNNKKVSFYTGLPSADMFKIVLESMHDSVIVNNCKLSAENQLLIVLMKLKLNLLNTDLAYGFEVSRRTVQRILDEWIPSLAGKLESLIRWPTQRALKKNIPNAFKCSMYRKTVCIIDCTEVAIERPSGQISKSQTWSNYKHSQTVKFLVGTTPSGQICYVSDGWGGRSSDKDVTLNCGILDLIKPGDVILADRGFQMEDYFAAKGAQLIVPTFTRGKGQLSKHEVLHSKRVSNVRIHVERVIGHIKKFRVLKGKLPITFLKYVDCVFIICAAICNLCPSIVN